MISVLGIIARALASLRLTLVCVAVAAVIAAFGAGAGFPVGPYVAAPFAVLFVNLVAAIITSRKLREQVGLLGFHLALATLALLVAYDRLASLEGHVEVTEGTAFDPALVTSNSGPLHRSELDQIQFVQGKFSINYAPGLKRRDTASTVFLPAGKNGWESRVVGDEHPLILRGYKFYTSFNKGFAPVLTYTDKRGMAHKGAVHLPSYPLNYYKQGNSWTAPGDTRPVKLWLHLPKPVYLEDASWEFTKPKSATLVVMNDDDRQELWPGEAISLNGGKLRFEEVRSWMGYTISYNPALPWIMAASIIAVLCLAWHVGAKMMLRSWRLVEHPREIEHVR